MHSLEVVAASAQTSEPQARVPLGVALPAMSLEEASASAASASADFMGAAGAFMRMVEDLGDGAANYETKSDASYRSSEWSVGVMRTEGEESELESQCGDGSEAKGDTEVSDGYVTDGDVHAAEGEAEADAAEVDEAEGEEDAEGGLAAEADALPVTEAEWYAQGAEESVGQEEEDVEEKSPSASPQLDWNSKESIELEKYFAFTYGKKFQERGPPAPTQGGPETWRGQAWREGKVSGVGRWGNRGQNSAGYARWLEKQNREKGKGKAKGGKGKGKGDNSKGKGGKKGEGKGGKSSGEASSSRVGMLPLAAKAPPSAPPQHPYVAGQTPPWRQAFGAYSVASRD